jgi:hypothetical protein
MHATTRGHFGPAGQAVRFKARKEARQNMSVAVERKGRELRCGTAPDYYLTYMSRYLLYDYDPYHVAWGSGERYLGFGKP